MLNKTKIALSALLVVGFASAAMASDSSETQGRQTYSFAAPTVQESAGALAYASAPTQATVKAFNAAKRAQFARASEVAMSH